MKKILKRTNLPRPWIAIGIFDEIRIPSSQDPSGEMGERFLKLSAGSNMIDSSTDVKEFTGNVQGSLP